MLTYLQFRHCNIDRVLEPSFMVRYLVATWLVRQHLFTSSSSYSCSHSSFYILCKICCFIGPLPCGYMVGLASICLLVQAPTPAPTLPSIYSDCHSCSCFTPIPILVPAFPHLFSFSFLHALSYSYSYSSSYSDYRSYYYPHPRSSIPTPSPAY